MNETYSIGALAKAGGVGVETVRYYERRKLLNQPNRRHGRMRRYGESDLDRLRFIKRAQAAGFTLDEVGDLIAFERRQSCTDTRAAISAKLGEVQKRLAALQRLRDELKDLLARCDANDQQSYCPALDALGSKRQASA
jgi:MerR family mercuric resistance operon transcriptional regulator